MSELLVKYASRKATEIPPQDLRFLITDFIKNADMIMSANLEKEYFAMLSNWSYNFINERYNYLPLNHIKAAFEFGALGQRGGTSKITPRNINIWLHEQVNIYQEYLMRLQKKQDEERRKQEMSNYKPAGYVATAVRMKVCWLADRRITGDQYDSFSAQKIYELLKKGVPERDIHPRDVIPNYDENESNT